MRSADAAAVDAFVGWGERSEPQQIPPHREHVGVRFAHPNLRGRRWLFATALVLTAASAHAGTATPETRALDKIVDATIARYHLPGIAVGVIEHGQVVYVRTTGETVAGSGQPITPQTLFKIASNSKAMTTALLGRLVDQGKLRWDDPVTKYLPQFRMNDPWVTANMRVADLLTHSSGLPEGGGDLMLWPEPNAFTRADIIHGLAFIKPGYSFRAQYQYDNLLYVVAGEVAAAAGGAPYETLMRREVFEPLHLDRCQVGAWNRDTVGDVATPHRREGGHNVAIPEDAAIPAITSAAAGGIRCDLTDMLAWARNWLVPSTAQLKWLSPVQRGVLQAPHMLIPVSEQRRAWDNTHVMAYGHGWRMADVDSQWLVWHTGTLNGMYSMLALLPDRKSGFVFMINGEADDARTVLGEMLVKHFTAPDEPRDVNWYADALERQAAQRPAGSTAPDTSAQRPATTAELASWTGEYRDPWFGDVSLCPRDGKLRFAAAKSPTLTGTVMRLGDRYLVHWDSGELDAWLDFHAATASQPITLRMAKLDPQGDFSSDYEDLAFQRRGGCHR
ncbi:MULTISPECIES: serine hydrolase [Rhodanobacter]|uniref:serine hydrolase n=1 Tax=Rhodanobacter TaxID=75309 RepID=UPI000414D4D9|nr:MULTISPECIES: serine hydrolase [Rhodanobacter]UJJ50572.1 serine hydrolase [Rhodanobacter denitrificans]UJM93288.1 serine hydrolase [Rhodanobacter denitrificans]UJM96820.1 serine hydrolase [Rhodanobacter denitrificans]UJN20352.1 serine hydrolase [Rhodanobacter denitrificans]